MDFQRLRLISIHLLQFYTSPEPRAQKHGGLHSLRQEVSKRYVVLRGPCQKAWRPVATCGALCDKGPGPYSKKIAAGGLEAWMVIL